MMLCLGVITSPLPAQQAGGPEIGLFGSLTGYDKSFGLRGGPGIGGHAGYFVSDHWSIELNGEWQGPQTSSGSVVDVTAVGVNVLYNTGRERPALYALAGYSHLAFNGLPPPHGDERDNALRLAVGGRVFISYRFALRLEGGAWLGGGKGATHAGIRAGLSMFPKATAPGDADHDGVPDSEDRCPGTPPGVVIDAQGCPIDSDADGVPDGLDACPNTPMGALVDAKGCPVDSDHDGVPDGIDQCPGTPAGVAVDARGCPNDADGDGVPDYLDKCPGTPAGTPVDSTGCPVVKPSQPNAVAPEAREPYFRA